MKTLQFVNQEITRLLTESQLPSCTDRQKKEMRKRIKVLEFSKKYLESNPSEAFVKQMLEDSKKKLSVINRDFKKFWKSGTEEKVARKQYDSLMNTKKVKSEIKYLKFLLY